jgi:hypothetical protein
MTLRRLSVSLGSALQFVHPPVEAHPEVEVGHIGFRDHDRRVDGDLG